MPHGAGHPSGHLRPAVPAVSHTPSVTCTCSPLDSVSVWEAEKPLMLGKCSSAMTKTPLNYKHCFQQIQNTAPYQALWRNVTLPQPKPAHCYRAFSHFVLQAVLSTLFICNASCNPLIPGLWNTAGGDKNRVHLFHDTLLCFWWTAPCLSYGCSWPLASGKHFCFLLL